MKMKRLLALISSVILQILAYIADWGFYCVGIFFTFTENWIAAIISLLFALVVEIKKIANKKTRIHKNIVKKVNQGRFDAVNVRYGRTFTRETGNERSAFQTGFDSGCDFILNLEDK